MDYINSAKKPARQGDQESYSENYRFPNLWRRDRILGNKGIYQLKATFLRDQRNVFRKLLQRNPNAHFSYVLGHNHLLKSKTGLFLSITAIGNLDINFDFNVVAQGLQKTNMQSIQRLLYFLNARTICTIFLHN